MPHTEDARSTAGSARRRGAIPPLWRARLLTALFCACVGLPFLVFNLFSRELSTDNHENRLLTTLPDVLSGPLSGLLPRLDTFLIDNAPFRYQFVELNAAIDYRLFGTTQDRQVLAGREGWLFYKAGPDAARPMADYQGLPDRNDGPEALAAAAASLQRLADTLAARGCTLVLDLAPSKDRVYREYMPDGYPIVDETNRADRLAAYLAGNTSVAVNWQYQGLRAQALADPGQLLYYKTDTHWNRAGTLLGLDGIFRTLGLPTLPFAEYAFTASGQTTGDMAEVAALYNVLQPEEDLDLPGYGDLFPEKDPRTVAVFGDSFSWHYGEFIGARFAGYGREELEGLTPARAGSVDSDILILEVTERNIDKLLALLAAF